MIAVTGANGQLGRLVLKHLERLSTDPIRALVRSPEKAADLKSDRVTVVKADYDDPSTLPAALEGVDRLLFISGSEIGKRVPQHTAVIEAATQAGVGFIAYTSLLNVPQSSLMLGQEHVETETLLKESGIAHVLLRNGWYLENFAGAVGGALAQGSVVGASGDGKFSAAGRDDYAEAAARIMSGTDLSTRALELGGHPAFSLADLASELSKQTGRDIPFNNLSDVHYAGVLVQAGLPEGFAGMIADADRDAAAGDLETSATTLEDLNGHPSQSMSSFVTAMLKSSETAPA